MFEKTYQSLARFSEQKGTGTFSRGRPPTCGCRCMSISPHSSKQTIEKWHFWHPPVFCVLISIQYLKSLSAFIFSGSYLALGCPLWGTLARGAVVRDLKHTRLGVAAAWASSTGSARQRLCKDYDYGQWCGTTCLWVSKVDVCQRNNPSLFSVEQVRDLAERRRFWYSATDPVEHTAQTAWAQTGTCRCYVLKSQMLLLFHCWSLGNSCVKHWGWKGGRFFPELHQ